MGAWPLCTMKYLENTSWKKAWLPANPSPWWLSRQVVCEPLINLAFYSAAPQTSHPLTGSKQGTWCNLPTLPARHPPSCQRYSQLGSRYIPFRADKYFNFGLEIPSSFPALITSLVILQSVWFYLTTVTPEANSCLKTVLRTTLVTIYHGLQPPIH